MMIMMMIRHQGWLQCMLILLALVVARVQGAKVSLRHSFPPAVGDTREWQDRGSVELPDVVSGKGDEVAIEQRSVSRSQWNSLLNACRESMQGQHSAADNFFYRIDAGSLGSWALPACEVVRSRLTDEIAITIAQGAPLYAHGRATLSVAQRRSAAATNTLDESFPRQGVWETAVSFRSPVRGEVPEVVQALAPTEKAKLDKEDGKAEPEPEPKSFIEKYWMMIVATAGVLIMQSFAQPPQQPQRQATGTGSRGTAVAARR